MASQPRLRVFAGPNGSGKSTLKDRLPPEWLGVYVNADDIEKTIKAEGGLDLSVFAISASNEELISFYLTTRVLTGFGLQKSRTAENWKCELRRCHIGSNPRSGTLLKLTIALEYLS